MWNAKATPGSASTTSLTVDQRRHPRWLRPLKRAPTAGPVAPLSQRAPTFSGLHSPMRVTSLTIA